MNQNQPTPPVEIPCSSLSEEALAGVIESYILREGTDYGAQEALLATKVNQIRKQLSRGDIKIVFDPDSDSVQIITSIEYRKLRGPEASL